MSKSYKFINIGWGLIIKHNFRYFQHVVRFRNSLRSFMYCQNIILREDTFVIKTFLKLEENSFENFLSTTRASKCQSILLLKSLKFSFVKLYIFICHRCLWCGRMNWIFLQNFAVQHIFDFKIMNNLIDNVTSFVLALRYDYIILTFCSLIQWVDNLSSKLGYFRTP